jgi:hypothetical protein
MLPEEKWIVKGKADKALGMEIWKAAQRLKPMPLAMRQRAYQPILAQERGLR